MPVALLISSVHCPIHSVNVLNTTERGLSLRSIVEVILVTLETNSKQNYNFISCRSYEVYLLLGCAVMF